MEVEERTAAAAPGSATAAWAVHLFTASGVVLGMLALVAVFDGRLGQCLLLLGTALVIDGVDGFFARRARVGEVLPRIDGEALDLIVDYLNYVLVPTLFIWRGGFLPEGWGAAMAALILLSSLYVFVRRDMKTADGYFRGFPALWNVVALYLYALAPAQPVATGIVAVLVVLTFAPVLVAHPFRVRDYGALLPIAAAAWFFASAALLLPGLSTEVRQGLALMSLATALAIIAMGLLRTLRGPRPAQTSANRR